MRGPRSLRRSQRSDVDDATIHELMIGMRTCDRFHDRRNRRRCEHHALESCEVNETNWWQLTALRDSRAQPGDPRLLGAENEFPGLKIRRVQNRADARRSDALYVLALQVLVDEGFERIQREHPIRPSRQTQDVAFPNRHIQVAELLQAASIARAQDRERRNQRTGARSGDNLPPQRRVLRADLTHHTGAEGTLSLIRSGGRFNYAA